MKRKKLYILTLLLFTVFVSSLFIASPERVSADGESYSFSSDGASMVVSGGDLVEQATLVPGAGVSGGTSQNTYSGNFKVSWTSWGWLPGVGGTTTCDIGASVTIDPTNPANGTLEVHLQSNNVVGSPETVVTFCTDPVALDFFSSTSVTIDTTNYSSSYETATQRFLEVSSYDVDYQSPATTDVITLKTQAGVTIEQVTVSLSTSNKYSYTFKDIDAGQYTVCSREAATCENVTKVANEMAGVGIGTWSKYDSNGVVTVKLEYTLYNLQDGATIKPIKIVLLDTDKTVAYQGETVAWDVGDTSTNDGLGGVIVNTFKDSVTINNVTPGTYSACNESTTVCEVFTKSDTSPAEVSLVLDGDEVYNVLNGSTGDDLEIGCSSESGSLGWIICPIIEMTLGFVDFMAGLIGNFLQVPPIQFGELNSQGQPNAQYQIWQSFRNISLAVLMIAMLVMVFGQALSLNIDAYTVKKMLPRIVIAAIAILLSIYIMAFLVDFFNVLGVGIADLVTTPLGNIDIKVGGFGDFAGILLGGIATGGFIVFGIGITPFIMIVLVPVALAFLAVYLTLVFRQVFIVMLIIVAPLALVAWTIPGTEKYFKTWFSAFIKALMMYPLIMLLLASGQVFAVIVTNSSTGQPGWLNTLTALVALAVPMFLVPATFKMAGGAIGAVGSMAQNMGTKLGAGTKERGQQKAAEHRAKNINKVKDRGIAKATTALSRLNKPDNSYLARKAGRFGQRLGGKAASAFRQRADFAADQLEKDGITDSDALNAIGQTNNSRRAILNKADEMEKDGKVDAANQMRMYANKYAGQSDYAMGAVFDAAKQGLLDPETAKNMGSFASGEALSSSLHRMGYLSHVSGRSDYFPGTYATDKQGNVEYVPEKHEKVVRSMGTIDIQRQKAASLKRLAPSFTTIMSRSDTDVATKVDEDMAKISDNPAKIAKTYGNDARFSSFVDNGAVTDHAGLRAALIDDSKKQRDAVIEKVASANISGNYDDPESMAVMQSIAEGLTGEAAAAYKTTSTRLVASRRPREYEEGE